MASVGPASLTAIALEKLAECIQTVSELESSSGVLPEEITCILFEVCLRRQRWPPTCCFRRLLLMSTGLRLPAAQAA